MREIWKYKKLFKPSLKVVGIFVFLIMVIKLPKIEGTNSLFTTKEKSKGNTFTAGEWDEIENKNSELPDYSEMEPAEIKEEMEKTETVLEVLTEKEEVLELQIQTEEPVKATEPISAIKSETEEQITAEEIIQPGNN